MGTGGRTFIRTDMHLFRPPCRFHKKRRRRSSHDLVRRGVHVPLPLRQVYPTLYNIYHHLRPVSCIVYQAIKHHQSENKQRIIKQLCSRFNSNCISPLPHRSSMNPRIGQAQVSLPAVLLPVLLSSLSASKHPDLWRRHLRPRLSFSTGTRRHLVARRLQKIPGARNAHLMVTLGLSPPVHGSATTRGRRKIIYTPRRSRATRMLGFSKSHSVLTGTGSLSFALIDRFEYGIRHIESKLPAWHKMRPCWQWHG